MAVGMCCCSDLTKRHRGKLAGTKDCAACSQRRCTCHGHACETLSAAPAVRAVRAGQVMSVTFGVIFAHTGTVALALIQPHTSCMCMRQLQIGSRARCCAAQLARPNTPLGHGSHWHLDIEAGPELAL